MDSNMMVMNVEIANMYLSAIVHNICAIENQIILFYLFLRKLLKVRYLKMHDDELLILSAYMHI